MKTLFALALVLASAPAFADRAPLVPGQPSVAPVLTAHRSPGFEMNPEDREFTLTSDGKLTLVVRSFRDNKVVTRNLGQLSAEAMKTLAQRIAAIDKNAKVVDPKEGDPQCTDTPYYTAQIYVAGVAKDAYRSGGCHEAESTDYTARSLAQFAITFLNQF